MVIGKSLSFGEIINSKGGLHLTAYLRGKSDPAELRARLAGLVFSALEQMIPATTDAERSHLLAPLMALMSDRKFLARLPENIGIFRTQNSFRIVGLPINVKDQCFVADSFHVKALLEWLQSDEEFFLVGINDRRAEIYKGSMQTFRRLDCIYNTVEIGVPAPSPNHALKRTRRARDLWIEEVAEWLVDWLERTPANVSMKFYLSGEWRLTSLLAKRLQNRRVSLEVAGRRFSEGAAFLMCQHIRKLIEGRSRETLERTMTECFVAQNQNLVRNNIFEIAAAAARGKVKKLIVASGINIFGKVDERSGALIVHPADTNHEDDDVLDDLAQMVIARGGEVLVAPISKMPKQRPALAILRSEVDEPTQRSQL